MIMTDSGSIHEQRFGGQFRGNFLPTNQSKYSTQTYIPTTPA